MPRSTRISTPSVRPSRQVEGSSRSRPRSNAKWLRVPALITRNGRSCSRRDPGDQRLGAVAAGDAEQIGAARDRVPGECGDVDDARARPAGRPPRPSPPPSPSARTGPPFPRRTGGSSPGTAASAPAPRASACPRSRASTANAAPPAAMASANRATDSNATHNSPARTRRTTTTIGARTASTAAATRSRPRPARNQYAPATKATSPPTATSTMPRLCRPANTTRTTALAAQCERAARQPYLGPGRRLRRIGAHRVGVHGRR